MIELRADNIRLKLEARESIGRAPTGQEFDNLKPMAQKWWAAVYPSLERYRKSDEGKYSCAWVFSNGETCDKVFRAKSQAVTCRKIHRDQLKCLKERETAITNEICEDHDPEPEAVIKKPARDNQDQDN